MSFDQFLFGIALVITVIVSLLSLTFARSFLGFLGLVVGAVANFALMIFLSVFVGAYCGLAYAVVSLIAGTLIEESIADNYDNKNNNTEPEEEE